MAGGKSYDLGSRRNPLPKDGQSSWSKSRVTRSATAMAYDEIFSRFRSNLEAGRVTGKIFKVHREDFHCASDNPFTLQMTWLNLSRPAAEQASASEHAIV
jgi:hypothetical protein